MKKVALLCALLSAAPSVAAADSSDPDVACVFVGMRMSQSPDERTRGVSVGTIMYYIGRLDGRNPKIDLQARLVVLQSKMTQDLLISEAKRCETQLAVRGRAINEMGRGMAATQKPAPDTSPPASTPPPAPTPPATAP